MYWKPSVFATCKNIPYNKYPEFPVFGSQQLFFLMAVLNYNQPSMSSQELMFLQQERTLRALCQKETDG